MSEPDLNALPEAQSSIFSVGDAVFVGNHTDRVGIIAYIGTTEFAPGEWIGIKLSAPNGKNDGSVNNVRYFECEPRYGLFTRREFLRPVTESAESTPKKVANAQATPGIPGTPVTNPSSGVQRVGGVSSAETPMSRAGGGGLQVGDRVQVSGSRVGTVRFIGPTDFAAGEWVGIELDDPLGKNDGSVMGRRYFTCKPNHGLFSAPSKITPFSGKTPTRPLRRTGSRESLLSLGSNFSSVSRQRPKQGAQPRRTPIQGSFSGPSVHALESVVKEKEAHIEQLLQEFEMERNELAKVTAEREMIEMEAVNQRSLIGQLQSQIEELQAAALQLSDENARLKGRVHEEVKKSEELQFRLEEEAIEKTSLENQKSDVEERIFELEEALAAAKEVNERIEAQLRENGADPANSDLPPADSRLVAAEARAAELEATLKKLQEEQLSADAQKQVGAKDAEIRDLRAQLASLQDSLLKAEQKLVEKTSMESSHSEELKVVQASEKELTAAFNQQQAVLSAEAEKLRSEEVNALVCKLAQTESELEAMRTKVKELESQIVAFGESQTKPIEAPAVEDKPASNQTLDPDALLDQLQNHVNKVKATDAKESEAWSKRLLEVAEEVRKLKGLEREPDEATTRALQQMSIRLLEAEAELAQKESVSLAQMSALTEAHLHLQEKQEESPAQTLVTEELRKRLEVLEAERCQLSTTLSERQKEAALLKDALSLKGTEVEACLAKIARLENELSGAVSERDRKLNELKAAVSAHEALGLTDEELLERVSQLRKQNEELERRYAASEARLQSLSSHHLQVDEEFQALKQSTAPMVSIDEQITAMQLALDEANYRVEMAERSSAAALQQLESKNLELQSLQERLLKVANEHEEFQDKQLQLVTSLETEKRIFMERVRRAEKKVERFEKETQAKSPLNPRSPSPVSNGRGTSRTSASGGANRSSYDSQLNFLNSIIVDLHAKNAELEQQLRSALENHGRGDANEKTKPLQKAKEKHASSSKLRFWCDNCEVFDLHDTEQCPNEPQFSRSNVVHRLARNVVPSTDRKYCDNCGIFDLHNTEECTEDPQETF